MNAQDTELYAALIEKLDNGPKRAVRAMVQELHRGDIVELLNQLSAERRSRLLPYIAEDFDADILVELEPDIREDVMAHLGLKASAEAIGALESDDAVQVMEDLEEGEQQELLEELPAKQRKRLEESLSYPEESAGRLMNRQYAAMSARATVGETIDFLRKSRTLPDDFYAIFIVDDAGAPIGYVRVSRVIRTSRNRKLRDIMDDNIRPISPHMDQEETAYLFQKYGLVSAPVIDGDGKLIAQITLDDVMDVIEEEAEEDILQLAGVTSTDLFSGLWDTATHRFPWLFINLLTAIAASAVIMLFQDSIEQLVALAVLMPIVASMAGNAGTQTLAVAVRGLATRELTPTNAKRIVVKELIAATLNGVAFALIVFAVSWLVYQDFYMSAVFAAATWAALMLAGLAGTLIPLSLVRAGVDPAIASSVFLTTITDMSSFFIFLGLAAWWLV